MASETEPAKLLLPYLQRADELQKHEPLVAYYCRLYAMERGLKIPQSERTKTTNSLLVSLMKQLEKDKKSLKLGPEDNLHLEGFALNVFAKADKQDRAGRADLNTAKTFYAASIFFEIINQFGPLQPDLEEKQKYAVWKAADIRKALKEGRKPTPGPPADEEDLSVPSSMPSARYDYGQTESPAASSHPEINTSTQFHEHYDQSSADTPASTQYHENLNRQHSGHIPSPSQFQDSGHIPPPSLFRDSGHIPPPSQFQDSTNNHSTANIPPSASYPSSGYPSHDYHPPPPDTSVYSQTYQHQYSQEPQHYVQQNYPPHETSPYSYPNFQSYPSFTESSLPSVPSHYPSYYQGSDPSYGSQSAQPPKASYSSTSTQYAPSGNNGTKSDPSPPLPQKYQYDSNYQPPAEKIAEAHKAARFAVGALAFDDVSVAVDHLRKSLELLTNPSASSH